MADFHKVNIKNHHFEIFKFDVLALTGKALLLIFLSSFRIFVTVTGKDAKNKKGGRKKQKQA
jgi:hypothetical protein